MTKVIYILYTMIYLTPTPRDSKLAFNSRHFEPDISKLRVTAELNEQSVPLCDDDWDIGAGCDMYNLE